MKRFLILLAAVASGWLIAQNSDGFGPEELAVTAPVVTSSGSSFDPSTVSGYALDYDVNALGLTDGTTITKIDDKSANKFHLLNYGGSYWTNNSGQLNNLGFAHFDGVDDYFQTNFTTEYSQNTTIFVVARFRPQNRSVPFLFDGGGAGGLTRQAVYNDGSWKAWAGQPLAWSPEPTLSDWKLYEVHFQGTTTSFAAVNGTSQTAGNTGTQSQKGFSLGIKYDDDEANTAWTGDIARVLFFSADVTGADLTYIRDGLISLYGLYPDSLLWRLNEGSGTAITGDGRSGGDNGTTDADWVSPSGLDFNGTTDDALTSAALVYGTNIITLKFRLNPDATNATVLLLESSDNANNNDNSFVINLDASGVLAVGIKRTSGLFRSETYISPPTAAWTDITIVLNGLTESGGVYGDVRVFYNGVEQTETGINSNNLGGTVSFASYVLYVGSRGGASFFYNGKMDTLQIWSGSQTP